MASDLSMEGRPSLAQLIPHATGTKVFLEAGIGKPRVEVDSTSVCTITSLNTMRSLEMEHVGHGTTETVKNGLAAKVVVVIAS